MLIHPHASVEQIIQPPEHLRDPPTHLAPTSAGRENRPLLDSHHEVGDLVADGGSRPRAYANLSEAVHRWEAGDLMWDGPVVLIHRAVRPGSGRTRKARSL